ncbi:hypothetical protein A3SI_14829 [Nitritalea halalkaliphila LW7]|uniref:Uncharacterized protein n=1 Tax=Nitritalea halalkaliphila LW7 TaxID=1189621 RepID=I5BZ68_9BACT|nr:hypothetical protein A3SI_14829 [Nitritalea halalkaliphila LW7]
MLFSFQNEKSEFIKKITKVARKSAEFSTKQTFRNRLNEKIDLISGESSEKHLLREKCSEKFFRRLFFL